MTHAGRLLKIAQLNLMVLPVNFARLINGSDRKSTTFAQRNNSQLEVESLEPRMMLSTVSILAAGAEGGETMDLQINGTTVQSWIVNGGAYAGAFQQYDFTTPATVTADAIRIAFRDARYDTANGIDENLRVDAIVMMASDLKRKILPCFRLELGKPLMALFPDFGKTNFCTLTAIFSLPTATIRRYHPDSSSRGRGS